MKVGFCYDTKMDYGYQEDNMEYTDFVSLHTVTEIKRALEQNGHQVIYIGNVHKLQTLLENNTFDCDIIFNIVEGFGSRNREALIPALCEIYKIPCTASDVYGMALNMNKHHTKILVNSIGIPVPKGIYFKTLTDAVINKIDCLGYPFILKPNSEGGSMGLYLIRSKEDFVEKASYLINKYSFDLLAEEYIYGKEITVPVIGNGDDTEACGVVAILNEDGSDINCYDNELKHVDNVINTLDFECSDDVKSKLLKYSKDIHRFFDLNDYSRMDFRVKPDGSIYFLEINAMPSLCRDGSFEQCGRLRGMEYYEVIGKILDSAVKRYNLDI